MGVRGSNPRGTTFKFFHLKLRNNGGLAQLARALALQARGHRFDSDILHFGCKFSQKFIDMFKEDEIKVICAINRVHVTL